MNPSSDQLKSCPFCGKAAKAVERNNPMSKWRWSVDCASTTCGMSGPVEATKFEAVEAWNRRSEVAESRSSVLTERLQAIIDWCDLALKNPQEFDSHGVRLLDGPVFDEARLALASPQPASTALVERLIERGQAFANQVRLITHLLHGQAYSTTVAELNAFDAALSSSHSTSREGER